MDQGLEDDDGECQDDTLLRLDHADEFQPASDLEAGDVFPVPENSALITIPSHQESRWQRLKKAYKDQYLELFNESHDVSQEESAFHDTQYGSVMWSSQEKESFFRALSRKGRHDLPAVSQTIGTKSVAEVKDYLCLLQDANLDRQMFSEYTKNVAAADIDAAIEIGQDCEILLDRAAEALCAFQENFDRAVARQAGHEVWLIDTETARTIDEGVHADIEREGHDEADSVKDNVLSFFHLSTFLDLSRNFFMNNPDADRNWRYVGEEGEEPAITTTVLEDYHDIVVSLIHRILQTAIFLALSRQRSTTTENYVPSAILKSADIDTALKILNMSEDSWDFWTRYPRRSGVNVVLGSARLGDSDKKSLTLREIEDALSVRGFRGRRRSLSSLITLSSSHSLSDVDSDSPETIIPSETAEPRVDISRHQSADDSSSFGESEHSNEDSNGHHKKRQRFGDDAIQDDYLEGLDQAARIAEEQRIMALMGEQNRKVEDRQETTKHRPLSKRKARVELEDWSSVFYKPAWDREVEDSAT